MTSPISVESGRSFLFVPGDRPERFSRARSASADHTILDLEDAVAPGAKAMARAHVRKWLEQGHPSIVRVNGVDTPWHEGDMAALAHLANWIMLPKADPRALQQVNTGGSIPVIALIETAVSLFEVHKTLGQPGVVRAAFGSIDLAADLGVDPDDEAAMHHARSLVVAASAANGLPRPVDGVTTALRDQVRLASDISLAKRMGFGAKLCIHPTQVDHVNVGFRPMPAEIEWARAVLTAQDQGANVVAGRMIDAPVLRRARQLLANIEQS